MPLAKGPGRAEEHKKIGWDQATRYAKMAVLRLCGLTHEEQAVALGTTGNQIRKWVYDHRDYIREFESFMKSFMPKPPERKGTTDTRTIAGRQEYVKRIEQKLGWLEPVLERALESGDPKLAMDAVKEIHKVLGMTQKLTVEHKGKVEHEHNHVASVGLLPTLNKPLHRKGLKPIEVVSITKVDDASDSPN